MADLEKMVAEFWAKVNNDIFEKALWDEAETSTAIEDGPTLTVRSLLKMSLSAFTGLDVSITDDFPNDVFAYIIDPKALLPFPPLDPDAKEVLVISETNAIKLQNTYLSERKANA